MARLGFADPARALANLGSLTPTPREADLLFPVLPRLFSELASSPDPDMALNNLERLASVVDRSVLYATLSHHPQAGHLLATLGGSSQALSDTLRRHPTFLPWLLDPRAMRQWLKDELAAELDQNLAVFSRAETRWNVLRRFKSRHFLRIGSRDLLGDADLTVTTEELSRLADVCLDAAWRLADEELRARYGAPRTPAGEDAGFAVLAMGKLGGEELNYSSDIDIIFVYSLDGETSGGPDGRLPNGEYFARVAQGIVSALESVTEEGYAFRVDLRLRPEGKMGALVLSLDGYRSYYAERAELWERQALIKARPCAGDPRAGRAFLELVRPYVYRPGIDPEIVAQIALMKRGIDRQLRLRGQEAQNVKLGIGGIREIEFLAQALQLLYGGDDPWLRERNSLRAIYRLTERGYLTPALGRMLGRAYTFLRTVEHRLQILHEFQTHALPDDPTALGLLARRMGVRLEPSRAQKVFLAEHRAVTRQVRRAFTAFFRTGTARETLRVRIPSLDALRATGFADPLRARQNLRLLLEGRPLVPYPEPMRRALRKIFPLLLDALWKSPDPDEALNQFERFVAATGPRVGYLEVLADSPDLVRNLVNLCARGELLTQLLLGQPELLTTLADPTAFTMPKHEAEFRRALCPALAPGLSVSERKERLRRLKQSLELEIVWRALLGLTTPERFSRELTALAEASVGAAWMLAYAALAEECGHPYEPGGRWIPAVVIALGKLGGRELTTGSDLDLFVLYEADGRTDGKEPVEAHVFYDRVVDRFQSLLGEITTAGTVFPVDLRLRPGSSGSGFANSLTAFGRYYRDWADLWERQALTKARAVWGDPRLARAVLGAIRRAVYGADRPASELKEIHELRQRMEIELGKETPGRFHVKFGRGGLVDVEFVAQALQLCHGHGHPEIRRANTLAALGAIGKAGLLPPHEVEILSTHYRYFRKVSAALRFFGARPVDVIQTAGPIAERVARALGAQGRREFLAEYARRTGEVRKIYERMFTA
jgi:glutamate-ammonia-ligase adenylyltransferase